MTARTKIGRARAIVRYFRDGRASVLGKLYVLATLVYVASPVDLIPDVPLIGWLDDMGFMALAVAFMWKIVGRYRDASVTDGVAEASATSSV